jgi:hypothetical protein
MFSPAKQNHTTKPSNFLHICFIKTDNHSQSLRLFFFLVVLGFELSAYTFEPLHQLFLDDGYF